MQVKLLFRAPFKSNQASEEEITNLVDSYLSSYDEIESFEVVDHIGIDGHPRVVAMINGDENVDLIELVSDIEQIQYHSFSDLEDHIAHSF